MDLRNCLGSALYLRRQSPRGDSALLSKLLLVVGARIGRDVDNGLAGVVVEKLRNRYDHILSPILPRGSKAGKSVDAFFDASVLRRYPVAHRTHEQLEILHRAYQRTLQFRLPGGSALHDTGCDALDTCCQSGQAAGLGHSGATAKPACRRRKLGRLGGLHSLPRSEEHTSELQS